MNILALDTSTEILAVTLRCQPGASGPGTTRLPASPLVYSSVRDIGLRHSGLLMPLVDHLLSDAGIEAKDIDLVACMRGPGSFTGLRIGMSTAKGLAAAIAAARGLDRAPIVSLPTLEVMAAGVPSVDALVIPVIDGRKGRFYGAAFHRGRRLTEDLDLGAEEISTLVAKIAKSSLPAENRGGSTQFILTGPHANLFVSRVARPQQFVVDPLHRRGHAETLVGLAEDALSDHGVDSSGQGPVYVRGSDAELSRKAREGRQA